jgi:hypothetical protein
VRKYWGSLLGNAKQHNTNAEWLKEEETEMENIPQDQWSDITIEQMKTTTSKLSNWKSAGPDQVQNFWVKYFTVIHPALTDGCNEVIKNPSQAPAWLTSGSTTLLHKKGPTEEAKNYRPITCLPTYYKLLTLFLTDKIYSHVTENLILPFEQKGCRRKARGCKDQLLLDRAITEDAKRKQRKVSFMWVDYK